MMPLGPELVLYTVCAFAIAAPVIGLVGYRQLADHFRRLPAATRYADIGARVVVEDGKLRELQERIRDADARLAERNTAQQEAAYWRAQVEAVRTEYEQLGSQRAELEEINRRIAEAQDRVAALEQELNAGGAALADLERRREQAERDRVASEAARDAAHEELDKVLPEADAARAEIARLRVELAEQTARLEAARTELAGAQAEAVRAREGVQELAIRRDVLEGEVETHRGALREVGAALELARDALTSAKDEQRRLGQQVDADRREVQRLNDQRAGLQREIDGLKTQKEVLEKALDHITKRDDRPDQAAEDPLVELRKRPDCLDPGLEPLDVRDEAAALERLRERLDEAGLRFPRRTLEAFHTCLKIADISPLTVLAGISGTGKSELPRRYAEALGLSVLLVPVQPRWDGPQDLLGFYNYLEHRYKATELLRALVRFDPANWPDFDDASDRVLLVLLDEMNLARVEYYFSEFLSLLEVRRSAPHLARIEFGFGGVHRQLRLADNLLYVGTMNEDETTQSLSDKVLDRANTLRFARPRRFDGEARHTPPPEHRAEGYLPYRVWRSWQRTPTELDAATREQVSGWIDHVNDALDGIGRPFGHRLQQAILTYVANHPGVIGHRRGAPGEAFVDQLEQRVFPKLRGLDIEVDEVKDPLNTIARLLESPDLKDEALLTAFERARRQPLFAWPGVQREVDAAP